MTREEFFALPPLYSWFPLLYPSGAKWEEFSGYCAQCNRSLSKEFLRGYVTKATAGAVYRDTDHIVYIIEATGFCEACVLITPYSYHLPDDLSLQGFKNGVWCTSGPPPKKRSVWNRVKRWWKRR